MQSLWSGKFGLKILIFLVIVLGVSLLFFNISFEENYTVRILRFGDQNPKIGSNDVVKEYYDKRKSANMSYSVLGRVLFLNEDPPPARSKIYKILNYKQGVDWEGRHLYYFGKDRHEPFEECSVSNCKLTYEEADLVDADAVIFHLHRFNEDYNTPANPNRPAHQRWIFSSDESPHHTFMMQPNHWFNYSGVFNWSMIYRPESDVPIAYGRVVPLSPPLWIPNEFSFEEKFVALVPYAKEKRRDVLVAILSSNCWANNRMKYVMELQKFINVDVFGGCATEEFKKQCPWQGYGVGCEKLRHYMFYLSFENSNCNGYLTEKFFTHALKWGGVPITMGMDRQHLEYYAPPDSFIQVEDFEHPVELAKFIDHINATFEKNYLKYHEWRRHFKAVSEDGYAGSKSFHYCRICQALNYNDESPRIYGREDLAKLLDPDTNCHPSVEWPESKKD